MYNIIFFAGESNIYLGNLRRSSHHFSNGKMGFQIKREWLEKDSKGLSLMRLPLMIEKVDFLGWITYLMMV